MQKISKYLIWAHLTLIGTGSVLMVLILIQIPVLHTQVAPSASDQTQRSTSNAQTAQEPVSRQVPSAKLFVVGDIMMGRNVEAHIKKDGRQYLFENVHELFSETDMVIGNLEGPIMAQHIPTPTGSTRFSFATTTAQDLKNAGFSALSLANNHALDYGVSGFTETRRHLGDAGIDAFGHPREASKDYILTQKINGQEIVLIGFNAYDKNFNEANAAALVAEMSSNQDRFVIVYIHWGVEYALHANDSQKTLAKKLIDSGADLIVGHHPHVAQNVDVYNGRLILYSLGNFIFDQYFSQDTQETLAIRIELSSDSVSYTLVPLQGQASRVQFMDQEKARQWLQNLAARSSKELRGAIEAGTILFKRDSGEYLLRTEDKQDII